MKLWLANKVIAAFYALLNWAWKVRMEAEAQEKVFLFVPEPKVASEDRKRMN